VKLIRKKFSSIEQGYTWQPAGLTYQDCERFFENYPNNRIPKLGTYGEKWREKALMFQMPKQDIARDFCRYLNNDSAKKYYILTNI
jgi:prickle